MSSKFRNNSITLLTKAMSTDMAEEYDQDEFTIYDEVGRGNIDRGRIRDDLRWFEIEANVTKIWFGLRGYESTIEYVLYGCVGVSNPKQIISREVIGSYIFVQDMKERIVSEYNNEGFSDFRASEQADWVISSFPNYGGDN